MCQHDVSFSPSIDIATSVVISNNASISITSTVVIHIGINIDVNPRAIAMTRCLSLNEDTTPHPSGMNLLFLISMLQIFNDAGKEALTIEGKGKGNSCKQSPTCVFAQWTHLLVRHGAADKREVTFNTSNTTI